MKICCPIAFGAFAIAACGDGSGGGTSPGGPGRCGATSDDAVRVVRSPLATGTSAPAEIAILESGACVEGRSITAWTEAWWHWTFGVPAADNPALLLEQSCAIGQGDAVYFVPAFEATVYARECRARAQQPVLVPLWVIVNDYPCPDPAFEPQPGQPLADFLTEGAFAFNASLMNLTVTLDGAALDTSSHRHTTPLFEFTADPSLVGELPDACLQGVPQSGVSDGWWLMLAAGAGEHELHVSANAPAGDAIDYRYRLVFE